MTTTPTLWGTDVTFSFDPFAFGPKVAALSDGTFAIAWENGTDLFGRHLNELGSFTGGNFLQTLSGNTSKAIHGPQIFEQADGRLVVEYRLQYSATDTDIHWHSADINNFPPSGNTFPIENSAFDEFMQDATALAAGGSAVAYQLDDAGGPHLVIRFVDALGNQASNRIYVDPSSTRAELNPALAKLGVSGNVMVAYESFHNTTFARDIRMHTYAPDGTDLSGVVIVSAPGVDAAFPDVVALEGPGFLRSIICWQQADGIAYRSYFGGLPIDAAPKLIAGSANSILPKITALKDGGFIVAWTNIQGTESDGSPDLDVALQRFDRDGNAVGSQVRIDKPGDQGFGSMSIATLDDGRVIITYGTETGDSTNINKLNYQIFDPRENVINATSGDDNWVGREDGSTMNGFGGNDKLTGREAQDFLNGDQGNDTLRGFGGNDVLDGGTEVDTMIGGQGNDVYRVDNVNDVVTELAGEGTDTVYTKVSYHLTANPTSVEQLRVLGPTTTNAVNLTGNGLNNVLVGNNGANALNGGAGADIMRGLDGNDIYIVDNVGDQVFEAANQGTDTVRTSVSYTLASGQSIEIFRVHAPLSINAINLTGNQLNNTIIGNNGVNVINGGAGNDTLIGSGGNDFFLFNTALNAATNVDTITAYSVAQDTIRLENAVFSTLAAGVLNADAFHIGAAAADAEDRIIYNSATGALSYDSNGTGAGGMIQFAKVAPGLAMTNAEFFVV